MRFWAGLGFSTGLYRCLRARILPLESGSPFRSGRIDPLWIEAGRSWQAAGRNQSPIILADRWDSNGVALTRQS